MSHKEKQYEFYCKHLEYHDSNVFKVLSMYFAFAGLFLFKITDFYDKKWLAMALVVTVGIVFFVLLFRTQELLGDLKRLINKADNDIDENVTLTIWPSYLGEGILYQLRRTSVLGCLAILIFTILVSYHLFVYGRA